jgi:hypothetical protein
MITQPAGGKVKRWYANVVIPVTTLYRSYHRKVGPTSNEIESPFEENSVEVISNAPVDYILGEYSLWSDGLTMMEKDTPKFWRRFQSLFSSCWYLLSGGENQQHQSAFRRLVLWREMRPGERERERERELHRASYPISASTASSDFAFAFPVSDMFFELSRRFNRCWWLAGGNVCEARLEWVALWLWMGQQPIG